MSIVFEDIIEYNNYMCENYLEVKDLCLKYYGGCLAVDTISFSVKEGEIFPIYGKFLSGKTSLLRCLASLEEYNGNIKYKDKVEKDISFTFGFDSLKKNNTVFETLIYPLKLRNIENANDIVLKKAREYKIDNILQNKIKTISDSEKHLVILVRALIRDCKMYLIDNPFNNFKEEDRLMYFNILMNDLKGKNVVYTTNNIDEAFMLNPKIGIMSYGKLIQIGEKEELLTKPTNVEVLRALGVEDFVEAKLLFDKKYYVEINNERKNVYEPISDIYLNKKVLIPSIDGKINYGIYFDYVSEYRASKFEV